MWIGELQWRLLHGYEFKTNPVLEPLDHIECRDALLVLLPDASANQLPPLWGRAGVGADPDFIRSKPSGRKPAW